MQFDQREYFFRDGMQCKSTNMYDQVNKYIAKYLLIMDGQIKSKRLCRSSFCERDMLSNCVKHKAGHMVASDFFFTSRNERNQNLE